MRNAVPAAAVLLVLTAALLVQSQTDGTLVSWACLLACYAVVSLALLAVRPVLDGARVAAARRARARDRAGRFERRPVPAERREPESGALSEAA